MTTAAFGIIKKDNKILLMKIAEPFRDAHKWNFPGGVIEAGEDIKSGLQREILEETNVVAGIGALVDSFDTINPDNSIYIYDAEYISGDIVIQEFEAEDARWFTVKQALELPLAFNIKSYIEKLLANRF